jgi:hypothetical protein
MNPSNLQNPDSDFSGSDRIGQIYQNVICMQDLELLTDVEK